PNARKIFGDHGCPVDEKTQIVKIRSDLVEDAIQSTPATYRAHAINPENDYVPGGKKTGFVNFGEAAQLIDPETRKLRDATRADVDNTVRFIDKLDNVVGWERPLTPRDLDEDMASIYNAYSFFKHSSKHGFLGIYSLEHFEAAVKMGAVIAGGEDKLSQAPLFTCSADPVSPLVLTEEATDVLIEACKFGVPIKINGLGLCGGTTCVDLASTLVTHNSEVLGSITLGQLVRKGAPMVYGSSTSIMDLRTTLASMGAPEMAMLSAAVAKLAQFYKMPSWVGGG
ncbi:MAG: trimethylamine methyltransferase family protein, partial [Deltaproteobacteria bacterium]|nr:trimethylamine methyltransferase family protein [Deltaproteobacteria bacterium]